MIAAQAALAIEQAGIAIVESFLPDPAIASLAAEAAALDRTDAFRPAGIGSGARRAIDPAVRGDRILWLDPAAATAVQMPFWAALETLRQALNERLLLGLFTFEGHYAIYPAGTGYARHLDRFVDDDTRVLSFVLYLNAGWGRDDGGVLVIERDAEAPVEVVPVAGRLVLFLSDRFPHAVLPARRERRSLTGWFRRRAL